LILKLFFQRSRTQQINYLINKNADTNFISGNGQQLQFDIQIIEETLVDVHKIIKLIIDDIPVDIFAILGMRNLSAFIGELFAKSFAKSSNGLFISNPHQDGYPDLLLMDEIGLSQFETLKQNGQLRDKSPFSPFPNGGIEIKATCGDVPDNTDCLRKFGVTKPNVGDTRISMMTKYNWKAHHRETNNLIGLLWDFENQVPQIVAVFFGNKLDENDWGTIVQPKEGGGRTTSVSIMPRSSVKKLYNNWLAVKNDQRYVNFLNHYNNDNLISK